VNEVTISAGRRSILVSFLAVLILIIGGATALVGFAWIAINQQEAVREHTLANRTLVRTLDQIVEGTATAASWDEAYRNLGGKIDPKWADRSIAAYYHTTFGHDVTLIFDPASKFAYAAREGARADLAGLSDLAARAAPFARQAQAREFDRRLGRAPAGPPATGNAVFFGRTLRSGGSIYLMGVATIAPTDGTARGRTPAAVIVTGRKLDSRLLAALDSDLGVAGARLVDAPLKGATFVPVPDEGGRPLGYVMWEPLRPGLDALRNAAGYVLGAIALLAAAFVALGLRIGRLFRQAAAKDLHLRIAMADLVKANAAAETANRAKSEFLANMSHEIRTPLNGVLGMAQVMELDDLSPAQRERVHVITRSGKTLLGILDDVLDLSKIEAGKLDIHPADFRLDQIIEGIGQTYSDLAAGKGVTLVLEIGEGVAGSWRGDGARLRQILLNLISNAIKFTDRGTVRLVVDRNGGQVRFQVIDEGIGIPSDKIDLLFEKFSQVDASATRRIGGTGLGLAICRQLAKLMRGSITVSSELGTGSTFTLVLPLERLAANAQEIDAPGSNVPAGVDIDAEPSSVSILAVDDNPTNRMVLEALLSPTGAALVITNNGEEALEAWEAQDFDVILMDIQMPVMDGVTATRRIRALEAASGRRRTPIIALTANAMAHQIEIYHAAGMDDHVSKPINLDRLYAAISGAMDEHPATHSSASTESSSGRRPAPADEVLVA
jgi:signal transduction histidine kinase/CheY-like chemotaxis protein